MKLVAIVFATLVLMAAVVGYNVTRAAQEPVTSTPGPLEIAQTQLHAQLEQARKTEAEAEKRDWNSPARLRAMIDGHAGASSSSRGIRKPQRLSPTTRMRSSV